MKLFLTIITIIFFTNVSLGQYNKKLKSSNNLSTTVVEKNEKGERIMPAEFPGGLLKFYSYIDKHLKYPKDAKKDKIEGKVFIEFIVDKDGSIKQDSVRVTKGLSIACDNEAVRLIKECPKWIPCTNLDTNEKFEMKYSLPITFKN